MAFFKIVFIQVELKAIRILEYPLDRLHPRHRQFVNLVLENRRRGISIYLPTCIAVRRDAQAVGVVVDEGLGWVGEGLRGQR